MGVYSTTTGTWIAAVPFSICSAISKNEWRDMSSMWAAHNARINVPDEWSVEAGFAIPRLSRQSTNSKLCTLRPGRSKKHGSLKNKFLGSQNFGCFMLWTQSRSHWTMLIEGRCQVEARKPILGERQGRHAPQRAPAKKPSRLLRRSRLPPNLLYNGSQWQHLVDCFKLHKNASASRQICQRLSKLFVKSRLPF